MLYGQLYQRLGRLGVAWGEPELTLYHNEEYAEHDIDMEVAAPIAPGIVAAPPRETTSAFARLQAVTWLPHSFMKVRLRA
jgi:hypothetical protein